MSSATADALSISAPNEGSQLHIPQITIHFFMDSDDMFQNARVAASDRRMAQATSVVHPGGINSAIEFYKDNVSPELIVVEAASEVGRLVERINELADVCVEGTKVILIGGENDVDLYRRIRAHGITEYAVTPVPPLRLIELVASVYASHDAAKLGKRVVFFGATGGCGASSIAQNTCAYIADRLSSHVLLTDFDLAFGSVGLAFNLEEQTGLAQALQAADRLDVAFLERVLEKRGQNLSLLPSLAGISECPSLNAADAMRIVDVASQVAPMVLLDVPHSWCDWVREVIVSADDIIVVAEPTIYGLRNSKTIVTELAKARPNDPPPRYVLNQVGMSKRKEVRLNEFTTALASEPIACIRSDPALFSRAELEGRTALDIAGKGAFVEEMQKIATAINTRQKASRKRWSLRRLLPW